MTSNNSGYDVGGIGEAEGVMVSDEYKAPVPPAGRLRPLLSAQARPNAKSFARVEGIKIINVTGQEGEFRLQHGSESKSESELVVALVDAANNKRIVGRLMHDNITAGSFSLTDSTGTAQVIEDDGEGNLVLSGTTTVVGTIDYVNGVIDGTYLAAAAAPITAAYNHTDCVDFAVAVGSTGYTIAANLGNTSPLVLQALFAGVACKHIVPKTIAYNDGTLTFVDDGKGNIIQTNTGNGVVGSVDYATGVITIDSASTDLATSTNLAFSFNPFAVDIKGGGMYDGFSPVSQRSWEAAAWGSGLVADDTVFLVGQTKSENSNGEIRTEWRHMGEYPFEVSRLYGDFPAGGVVNDARI